jgi:carbamoylphosphate synthase small subunit
VRTRKIVRKLRSRGKNADRILDTLSKAHANARREQDRDWWGSSKLRKSLISQVKMARARKKAKDEKKQSRRRKKKAVTAA